MAIQVGKVPENFELQDQNDDTVSLKDMRGKKVLLSFHPLAFTGVCTQQMEALEDNYERFEANNTVPVGLSVDPQPSKAAWAESMGLENLKILSDRWPTGYVAQIMDVYMEDKGLSQRANILLDEKGKVIWTKVYEISELPDLEEVFEVLED